MSEIIETEDEREDRENKTLFAISIIIVAVILLVGSGVGAYYLEKADKKKEIQRIENTITIELVILSKQKKLEPYELLLGSGVIETYFLTLDVNGKEEEYQISSRLNDLLGTVKKAIFTIEYDEIKEVKIIE